MNIYIHLEVSAREFDSKLLLAVVAASRGHEVLISDQESIIKGLKRKLLKPGIFHTKSLTPGKFKIIKHDELIRLGCKITSIDEEGGLVDYGYEKFVKLRYSSKTIKQASAVFAWGPEDYKSLKKNYPNYSKKIFMTGSPRADLWRPFFWDYWKKNFKKPKKPFLLVSSNLGGGLSYKTFNERIRHLERGEYIKRDPGILKKTIIKESEQSMLIYHFVEAIKYLAHKNKNYKIILRPHPSENIDTWKIFFNATPNVSVIREEAISLWIRNTFAILHNGCTTALEASFAKKPIITFAPFAAKYSRELANDLGLKVKSLKELSNKVNFFFNKRKINEKKIKKFYLPKILVNKIHIDEKEIATKKVVKVWESIGNTKLSKLNNWLLFYLGLKVMKLNGALTRLFKSENKIERNYKFPSFDEKSTLIKINKLKKILKINQEFSCKLVSDRTLLIKKK